jgi:hypothetical protein
VDSLTDLLVSVLLWPSPRIPWLCRLSFYKQQRDTESLYNITPLPTVFRTLPQIYRYPTTTLAVLVTTKSLQTLFLQDGQRLVSRDILSIQDQRVIHLIQDLYNINHDTIISLFDLTLLHPE